jgi:hypothetical protein
MANWRYRELCFFSLLVTSLSQGSEVSGARFVGPQSCALCHKDVAAKQERSAMALTWQGHLAERLPQSFDAAIADDLHYELKRNGETLTYSVEGAAGHKISLPVDIAMGGLRHGLGFLVSLRDIDGIPLTRPALIQARYAWNSDKHKLLLAPGCSDAKPQSLEASLGLVLSPTFEARCLACHGQPNSVASGKDGGVHCESCHGPGSEHLKAVARGTPKLGIVNPKRLAAEDSIGVCAQCHIGLTHFSDPSPVDLLVANQVRAIESSECFIQSGKAFSCTACHDPHSDAASDVRRSINACLGCHSTGAKPHAAICPVNATAGCIGCHMPSVEMGPLHLVDHVIRVHPEQSVAVVKHELKFRTQVRPIAEYLRIITTTSGEKADVAHERIALGESFYNVAREISTDRSAAIGGYLGRETLLELGGVLPDEAASLKYGETSKVVRNGVQWVILQRLPRDFRWDAEQLQYEAEDLANRGPAQAIEKAQEALMIYPQFLRALDFIGVTFAQNGNPKKGASVLATAARLYPDNAETQFALASALGSLNDNAGASAGYRRAIMLEPDFTAAYVNLGMLFNSSNDWQGAIQTFRQGLQIDPLSAELYYDLGLALAGGGDAAAAAQAAALAQKLDPTLIEQKQLPKR